MPATAAEHHDAPERHRAFQRAAVTAALAVLGLFAFLVTDLFTAEAKKVVSNAAFVVASAVAAWCCARAARREVGRLRRAWGSLCALASLWTVGNLISSYYQVLADNQPYPALNDVFYLAALVPAVIGMLTFPAAPATLAGRLRSVMDGLMVASALLLVSWVVVLGPAYRTTGLGPLARAVYLAYPVGDVVIVTLAMLVATRGRPGVRMPLILAAVALGAYAVADSLYALRTAEGNFAIGTPLDVGWVSGYLMLGLAALAPGRPADQESAPRQRFTLVGILLPYVPVFLALAVVAVRKVSVTDDPFLFATGLFLFTVFAGRQCLILTENAQLSRDLEAKVDLRTADLRRLGRRTESILESAGEGIYGVDVDGRATFVNPSAAALVGYPVEELIGKRLHDLIHHASPDGEPLDWEACPLSAALKKEATVHAKDEAYWRKDGSRFPVEYTATPMRGESGELAGAVVVFRDVTERRAMDQMKDEFISVVSHELRTPLTSIRGALGLLAGGALGEVPEKGKRMMDIAVENTDRLVRLINDILDIERMTSGKVVLNKETCDVSELMGRVVELMGPLAAASSVEMSVEVGAWHLWADPDRLVQTLTNLISNAVKFSPPGSTVEIQVRREGDDVVFTVADQGRGIPPDQLESIFGRFQQVDASDSRDKGGTGLGLAICRGIVEQHGGRVWAENRPGGGALFTLTLPAPADAPSPQSPDNGSEPVDGRPRPAVLVCDDDPMVRQAVETMLERHGFRPLLAASGEEAVEMALAERPAAILLDLLMPAMSGWDTAAALKSRPETADIPIVVLSVLPPDGDGAQDPAFSDWVAKSSDENALLRALESTMRGRSTPNVLIVEDDLDLAGVLQSMFQSRGLATTHVTTGSGALDASQRAAPDLLVLDLGLPDTDGFAVVDWMRRHDRLSQVPMVVYTARDLDDAERRRLAVNRASYFTKGRVSPEDFERHVVDLLDHVTSAGNSAPPVYNGLSDGGGNGSAEAHTGR